MSRLRPNTHTLFTFGDAYRFQYCANTTSYCMFSIKTDNLFCGRLNKKEAIGKTIHRNRNKQIQEILFIKVGILLLNSHKCTLSYIYLISDHICANTLLILSSVSTLRTNHLLFRYQSV